MTLSLVILRLCPGYCGVECLLISLGTYLNTCLDYFFRLINPIKFQTKFIFEFGRSWPNSLCPIGKQLHCCKLCLPWLVVSWSGKGIMAIQVYHKQRSLVVFSYIVFWGVLCILHGYVPVQKYLREVFCHLNAENLTCGEAGCACLMQRQTGSAPPRAFTSIQ